MQFASLNPGRVILAVLALAAVLALGACSNRYKDGTNLTCPRALFVAGTDAVTKFAGAARTDDAVTARVQLSAMQYGCSTRRSDARADLSFSVNAVRRDTAQAGSIDVPYFVAVADAQGRIIAKQLFTTRIAFAAGAGSIVRTETVQETIPLAEGQNAVGYEILVGIQLTPEELEYNMARR